MNTETSMESIYWFNPQSGEDLLSEDGEGAVAEYGFVSSRIGQRNL